MGLSSGPDFTTPLGLSLCIKMEFSVIYVFALFFFFHALMSLMVNITLIEVKVGLLPAATYSVGGVYMSGLDQSKVGLT